MGVSLGYVDGQKMKEGPMPERPHIIFILSDQHHRRVAGFAGDPIVRTPNIDRLAATGVVCRNAYCASPLCVPSRMSLLAGQHISSTECTSNATCLRSDRATFVHSLAVAGYETVLAGRMHFVGMDQRHGFATRLVGDITATILGGQSTPYGEVLRGLSGQNGRVVQRNGPGRSSLIAYDEAVTAGACEYLRAYNSDAPLLMTIGHYGPHCPYVCPPELFDYYYERLENPPVPEGFADAVHPAVRQWYANRKMEVVGPEDIRRARAAYYGLVELLDRYVGDILSAVDASLGLENCLVIYGSDHGDMIGENGLWWKSNMYEGSVGVPLIWSAPGRLPQGRELNQLVSLLDVAPTLIGLGQGTALPEMHGRDLLPVLVGDAPEDHDRAIVSMYGGMLSWDEVNAMVRQGDWKLVEHDGYEQPQLFNLADDPREQNDLGTASGQSQRIAALRRHLSPYWDPAHLRRIGEQGRRHFKILTEWGNRYADRLPQEFWPLSPDQVARENVLLDRKC
jgi:choline-sulfatase